MNNDRPQGTINVAEALGERRLHLTDAAMTFVEQLLGSGELEEMIEREFAAPEKLWDVSLYDYMNRCGSDLSITLGDAVSIILDYAAQQQGENLLIVPAAPPLAH